MRLIVALFAVCCFASVAVRAEDKPTAKVTLAELDRAPEKFAGQTVQFEGIVEETPRPKPGAVLMLERCTLTIVCESKPEVVAGDRVRVTAVCEGKGSRLKFVATTIEKIRGNESAIPVTFDELKAEPKKYDGKLILLEGVLKNIPEAIEFGGEYRYSVRMGGGVAITGHGRPTAVRGDRVRVFGVLTYSEESPTRLLLDANAVEVVPR